MKKILIVFSLLLMAISSSFAQSLSGPTSVISGDIVYLTFQGESSASYQFFSTNGNINNFQNTIVSPSYAQPSYVTGTILGVTNTWQSYAPTPSQLQAKFTLNNSQAVTATFYIPVQIVRNGNISPITIPYTVTVNPIPVPPNGGQSTTPPSGGGTNTNFLYRFRNPSKGNYIFTNSNAEYTSLVQSGWQYEGALGFTWTNSQSGTTPIVRFRKNSTGEYIITTSNAEMSSLSSSGWTREGNVGYVYSTQVAGSTPLYRYYATSGNGGHIFTTNFSELGNGNSGWTYEGIACYVLTTAQ